MSPRDGTFPALAGFDSPFVYTTGAGA